ncbi:hypothetical protein AB0C33_17320 [Nonomuraea sp. NPDC048881]|uniref:hypothetical protein n=1 Tax=unclassified Nonomuraea TaxID=2593643 RepID=UPI0033DDE3B6
MTATEASRNSAAVIAPAPTMVKAFLARSTASLDPDFETDVAAAREALDDEMRDTWPDA